MLVVNLPICPKCGNTKFVTKIRTTKLEILACTWECETCRISWRATPNGNFSKAEEI